MKKAFTILLIVVFLLFGWFSYSNYRSAKKLEYNCRFVEVPKYEITGWLRSIAECYGRIVVGVPFQEKYYGIEDYVLHRGIAEIKSISDINMVGNKIYFKPANLNYMHGDTYKFIYFDGNEDKIFDTDSVDKLPKYLIVDIMTGATVPYVNFEDIPQSEQINFKKK